jgi:hypothetical protein
MTTRSTTMNVNARALLVPLAALAIAACSSPAAAPTDGAASDTGGLPTCPETVADYCAQHPGSPAGTFGINCATTLAAAGSDPYFCSLEPHVTEAACQTYAVIHQMGVDTGFDYYYDANSALFAITSYSANFGGSTTCVAGPPMLAIPHSACATPAPLPGCPADGSVNGG